MRLFSYRDSKFKRHSTLEVLIVILLLFFGVLAIHAARKNSTRHDPRSKLTRSKTTERSAPFDAKSARPRPTTQIILGPAYVIDGDSVVIRKTQVRLFGVDAPEMNHPYGKKAKWALVSLCKGQTVRAEVTEIDAYGRTVAKCYLPDGRDLSAEMVKLGLAIDWPKFSGGKYQTIETPDARTKLWLADARQKGRMHVWEQFDYDQRRNRATKD